MCVCVFFLVDLLLLRIVWWNRHYMTKGMVEVGGISPTLVVNFKRRKRE